MRKRAIAAGGAALLLVAGCAPPPSGGDPVNAEDVMFVQMMVQHHRQGIELVKVGEAKATRPELKTLAAAIETTQQDEVEMMLRWLHAWDQPLTAPTQAHEHHGGMPETDRRKIAALRSSGHFERDFLTLLIAHQGDAVRMAGNEESGGANPAVKRWAAQVEASRKAQIEQMRGFLKR
ncbi:DUF305 domain-containing protein [Nonomuraea sp. NPDC000554]|uniref:DUF305 domain-containing protein n=1 Tax=Nonomuraea sp. NPDC000554 TaxID=3154259 RepID=UPI00332715DD